MEAEIQDLAVLDSEAMHLSVISPTKMTTWVDENVRITKNGIKEISSITIQIRLSAQLTKGPKAKKFIELNDKWANWEKSVGKASSL